MGKRGKIFTKGRGKVFCSTTFERQTKKIVIAGRGIEKKRRVAKKKNPAKNELMGKGRLY